ncbi:D-alanyl-D-alanine endopeptidase [Amphritea japonica ATCC BAA-1530]|uniref:D-alanyl-D-alanine endopeptidase n=2 Tax=Amphritea TaxID=515417 RepID=A0A7R6P8Y0_9GAMM|nr:D-alanyl-D-alanine endopeptidase [Amphritea japonica ATCC BAA-1530]
MPLHKRLKTISRLLIGIFITSVLSLPAIAQEKLSVQTTAISSATQKLLSLNQENIELASVSAAVIDARTGAPLYSKNAELILPIASVTKLMTAMVTLDSKLPLNEKIRFTQAQKEANNNYYTRIRIGSLLPRKDVIRIALMSSENMAASALGHTYPGGNMAFVKAMNLKALQLGMTQTTFVDSSGLSERNISSASDLAIMVRAAASYPEITKYSTTKSYTARFTNPGYSLRYGNTNVLVHRKSWSIDVTKTGYLNEAGRCLVMMTKINGRDTVMVMLNSYGKRTPIGDAGRIKRWITTGKSGKISSSARHYQRQVLRQLMPEQLALN